MADTLLGILEKTTDARECMAAQKQLEQAAQSDLPNFLVELSRGEQAWYLLNHLVNCTSVLANPKNNEIARYQAALQIKNHLTSNNQQNKMDYQQRWLHIDASKRMEIKKNSFNALGSETRFAPHPINTSNPCISIGDRVRFRKWLQRLERLSCPLANGTTSFNVSFKMSTV